MRPPSALNHSSDQCNADWRALGTSVRLVVTDPDRLDEGRFLLESDLAALDAACSRFRPDSELRLLEDSAGRTVTISPLLTAAILVALHAAAITGGDLDPTMGGALRALGYDRTFERVAPTGPAVRLRIREWSSWQQLRFDPQARTLTLPPGTALDLGATAKAWAADRAAAKLAAVLRCGVLVSLGGDIAVAGQVPNDGWRIRVQDVTGDPDDPPVGPSSTVALLRGGLATSSTVSRRWLRGGDVMHHILDPRTRFPAAPVWRTVSVAADSALDANIASTVAVIRGHAALRWLADLAVAARLVDATGTVHTLGGWPEAAAA
jgi:thiamine biosynthesis lipoprotein